MTEREFAIDVVRRLRDKGFQALWAGGCVRDELLGYPPKDYDVATDAHPEKVASLFHRTIAVGASFGVIEVLGPRMAGQFLKVQVATFRSDVSYSDGRHPDRVVYSTAREDALRRDFTINGMFQDPLTGEIIDYVGGRADLDARILRAIGDVEKRFEEDKLRMLRAVRMAMRFGLSVDPATASAIQRMASQITIVSAERIADELRKILVHPSRARGMSLFLDYGLAEAVLPEIVPMKDGLWDHLLRVLELLGPDVTFPLAFAALLHKAGQRLASDIGERLRLSNEERERIEWLVEKHQLLCEVRAMKGSKLKPVLAHAGIRELLALHRADALASGKEIGHVECCEQLLREWTPEDLTPAPLLTGHDLLQLGLEPGPLFKELLDAVREPQLDGSISTKEQALDLVARLLLEKGYCRGDDGHWRLAP